LKFPIVKPQIRVLIVEDDVVDRLACRRAIAKNPDYDFVLFEAATGKEGLRLRTFTNRTAFCLTIICLT
jgi:hypothetical protein